MFNPAIDAAPREILKVLIAEDDADCRNSLQEAVRCLGHSCSSARDGVEAWAMYEADRADVILSDWEMPGMDGLHLCQKVQADDSRRSHAQFIFVTGNDERSHLLRGMRAGADDYIAKPVDLDELEARLEVARGVRDSTLRRDGERACTAARTDPLTDAFNRVALEEDLEALAARAGRYGHRYCAALCDIDGLGAYNAQFGHLRGDDVIRRVARTVRDALRRGDVSYRYGGEEFLVILPEQSLTEAALGMDRVRSEVQRLQIPQAAAAGSPLITISVGIAALSDPRTESIDGWLRRTDGALRLAKAGGRNRVSVEGSCPAPGAA